MRRILGILVVSLVVFCADRIVRDNPFDPDNDRGDYAASVSFTNAKDTLFACSPCTLLFTNKGKDSYRKFVVQPNLPVLTQDSDPTSDEHGRAVFRFTSTGKYNLLIYGVRQNRSSDSIAMIPITVVNPYAIDVDSASLMLGYAVKFRIKNSLSPSDKDQYLVAKWYRAGERAGTRTTLRYDSSYSASPNALPDTLLISATLSDTFGCSIQMDTLHVPVLARHLPFVNIVKSHLFPPVNIPYIVEAMVKDADSLTWRLSTSESDTVITSGSDYLEYLWKDTLQTTVVVTAKNRFNTIGMNDTVIVKPKQFAYGFREPLQKRSVLAGKWEEWSVQATENGIPVEDTSLKYLWNVEPRISGVVEPNGNRIRINVKSDIPSFTLSVMVTGKSGTSFEMFQTITVVNHKPEISVKANRDSIHIDDSTTLTIATSDVNFGGTVDSVYYRFAGDATVRVASSTSMTLAFKKPGWQHIYFWCIDNDRFSSDTIDQSIYVWTDIPFFGQQYIDTVVYVDDQFRIPAYAETRRTNDEVVKWLWFTDTTSLPVLATTEPFIDTLFTSAGRHHIWIKCISKLGDTSRILPVSIRVSSGYPVIRSAGIIADDSLYVNDQVLLSFSAIDSSGMLSQIRFFANDIAIDTMVIDLKTGSYSDTIKYVVPAIPGKYQFSVAAVDDDNYLSSTEPCGVPVEVRPGLPVVESFSPDSIWAQDTVLFSIDATDENLGILQSWHVRWHPDSAFVAYTDQKLIRRYFADTGTVFATCYVVDEDGMRSAYFEDTLQVRPAIARIAKISVTSAEDSIYINDTVTFSVQLTDPNDTVLTLSVSVSGDDDPEYTFKDTNTLLISFVHVFTNDTNESRKIKFRVVDSDENIYDTLLSLKVKNGAPAVTSVDIDTTDGNVFVNDVRKYTVKVEDENGYIRRVYVNWYGGDHPMDSVTAPDLSVSHTSIFTHAFSAEEMGTQDVRFWVVDDDGVRSPASTRPVTVRAGRPLVTSAWCDSTKLWVNDSYRYHVSVTDTNGTICKVYADWNADFAVDESLDVSGSRSSVDTFFTHAYDTSFAGKRTPRFSVSDEDGIVSLTRDTSVTIDLGAPQLWGDSGDTLWIVVDNANDYYTYKVNHHDSNGTIDTFYFGNNEEKIANATKKYREDSTTQWVEGGLNVHWASAKWIWVKDDDGILRGKKFWAYSDSAPPAPLGLNKEQTSDSVQIQWDSAALDFKDKIATQIRIMIRYGNSGDPDQVLMDWTEAGALPTNGTKRYFKFAKSYTGDIRYRIILRDKRGTESESEVAPATIN